MAKGKLILIEGTDCSGKETQSNLLLNYLKEQGYDVVKFAFPQYESPTGRIIGGPYLDKPHIGEGWFPEGATNVDPKVSSLYYAADRAYHLPRMKEILDSGTWIILDRYFYSNLAHQGGKIENKEERLAMYQWLEKLELELLGIIEPDIKIFLHMPYECSCILKQGRGELPDQLESSESHLRQAENAFLEIAERYDFSTIECGNSEYIKTIDEIHQGVVEVLKKHL